MTTMTVTVTMVMTIIILVKTLGIIFSIEGKQVSHIGCSYIRVSEEVVFLLSATEIV